MTQPERPLVVCRLLNTRLEDMPFTPGDGPDPRLMPKGLVAHGFVVRDRRLGRFPWNPLARLGTFYAGFDVLRALRVLLFDRDADLVFCVGESNVAVVLLLGRLFRFRVPIVLREVSSRGWRHRDRVMDFVVPRVAQLDLLTPHQMRTVPTQFRLRAPPRWSGFAVDEEFFRPGNAPDGGYVLAVGDDMGRDYPVLVEACRMLPYRLVLRTGTRPAVPDGMRDRVTLTGRLSYVELRALYRSASAVVVPLRTLDHPSGITAIFEGMAMGRLVIASDVGSAEGVIEHGRNGLLVPPGDAGALRDAIRMAMEDEPLRARLGSAARADIEGPLSYQAYMDRTAENLRAAAGGIKSPRSREREPDRPGTTSQGRV